MDNKTLFASVTEELAVVEAELNNYIISPVNLLTEVGSHLVRAGGKRLRPALYLMCSKEGCTVFESLLPIAVAIELIHMATLVHDDVIDDADTRRGVVTANVKWGKHVPVLTGDYLFAKAFSLVADQGDLRLTKILANVVVAMCEGEIMQSQEAFNSNQTEEHYFLRIEKKTADFIAASCELGALSAKLPEADVQAMRRFGYALGMAFQITDDILDVTSSSLELGKPAGNDLRQGIITLPVIYALQNSPFRGELVTLIRQGFMNEKNVLRSLEIINNCNAVKLAYSVVARFLDEAYAVLPQLQPEIKRNLVAVADFIGIRRY